MGVFFKSLGLGLFLIPIVLLLVISCFIAGATKKNKKMFLIAPISLLIIFGAFYYTYDDIIFQREVSVPLGKNITFSGLVDTNPKYGINSTEFVVKPLEGFTGSVLVRVEPFQNIHYGDVLKISGKPEKAEGSYERYLEKERIHSVIAFPKVEKLDEGRGSILKTRLYQFRNRIDATFSNYFSSEQAAFLGGLTLGTKAGFSKKLQEAFQKSGTSHLVALSGYNISIIAWVVLGALTRFLGRRWAVVIATFIILGFVVMTGAEASVVRAAVLAFIAFFGKEYGRAHDVKNAILLAALIMIIVNPKVLAFDVGFQLSFLAFIGIVYLKPILQRVFHMGEEKGFLSWRENLFSTLSAQIMVSPILISQFGYVSLIGIITNLLILGLVPYTMFFGFLLAFFDLVLPIFARVISLLLKPLLGLELFIIQTAARVSLPISPPLHWITIVAYYGVLGILIVHGTNTSRTISRA